MLDEMTQQNASKFAIFSYSKIWQRVLEVKKLTNKNVSQLKQQCLHFEGAPARKFFNLQDPFKIFLKIFKKIYFW